MDSAFCRAARLLSTVSRFRINDTTVWSWSPSVVDTVFSASRRTPSCCRRWSTAAVTLPNPSRIWRTCVSLPLVTAVTWFINVLSAPASDRFMRWTEMLFRFVMSTGVCVRDSGISSSLARGCDAAPSTSSTERRPSSVSMWMSAEESFVRWTLLSTASVITTWPFWMSTPATRPAFSPATVTWSPFLIPAASEKTAYTL